MTGETNLDRLIAAMEPVLQPETFVFVTTTSPETLDRPVYKMRFEEAEGTTFIMSGDEAARLGLAGAFACRMITLNIHSSLEAVGFMARIATRLASLGMGVNPVAGYFHDHLFIPANRADDAMKALRDLSASLRGA